MSEEINPHRRRLASSPVSAVHDVLEHFIAPAIPNQLHLAAADLGGFPSAKVSRSLISKRQKRYLAGRIRHRLLVAMMQSRIFLGALLRSVVTLEATMNRRRQLLSAIGLGSLFAGLAAVVPCEALAAPEKPSTRPAPRTEYKVVSVPAGDRIEDIFNAVAREGFQYAGSAQRYGQTEFIFVKWVNAASSASLEAS